MFGALPLAFGTGEGSELRHPLGITIVGGLLFSQALTLYTTPVIFLYLDRFGKWLGRLWRRVLSAGTARAAGGVRIMRRRRRCAWPTIAALALPLAACAPVGPDYLRPAAIVPGPIQGNQGLEARHAARRFRQGRMVAAVPRSRARSARGAGRRLQPDAQGRRGQLPRGAGADRRGARRAVSDLQFQSVADARQDRDADRRPARRRGQRRAGRSTSGARCGARSSRKARRRRSSAADLANATLSAQSALALAYVQLREADSLARSARQHGQAIQALARHHAEPVQRGHRREVRRHHRPGARYWRRRRKQINVGVARAQSEHAIAVLIGRPPAESDDPARQARARRSRASRCACPPTLLERRPDIAAAERTMQEQNAAIGVAIAGYYPEPDASAAPSAIRRPVRQGDRRRQSGLVLRPVGRADAVQRRPDRRAGRGGAPDLRGERRHLSPDGADRVPAGRGPTRGDPAGVASARRSRPRRSRRPSRRCEIALNEYRAGTPRLRRHHPPAR